MAINNNKLLGDKFTAVASTTTKEGVHLILLGEGAAAFGNHGVTTASRGEDVDFEAPSGTLVRFLWMPKPRLCLQHQ